VASTEALLRRVDELERRLRIVEDVAALQRLKARYGQLADARYDRRGPRAADELERIAGEIAALFTEDAVWDGGPALGCCRGRREIFERMREPTLRFSWHYFVKPNIEVEGDAARGTWDILAPCTSADGTALWMAGFEEDEYRRIDGRWLHSRMRLGVVFMAPHETGWAQQRSGSGRG
jgi:hypothetical protein